MGTIGAIKAKTILENVNIVFAIELMTACQALDCREIKSSPAIEAVKSEIRKTVNHLDQDRIMSDDINNLTNIIDSDIIPEIVNQFIDLR
jgi:histidine ammonia-lyase